MERQIKFRAKVAHYDIMMNPEDGWVYGFYYQDLCGVYMTHFIKSGEMVWRVKSETIGQFTGLLDAKQKEIYEGDILQGPSVPNFPLEVRYNTSQGAFCLVEHTHTDGELLGTCPLEEMLRYYPDMRIIGNRSDNPLLISDKQ